MTTIEISRKKPQSPHRYSLPSPGSNGANNLLPTVETSKQQNKSSLLNSPSPVPQQNVVERSVRINTASKEKATDRRPTNGLLSAIDMDEKETKLTKKEPNAKRLSSSNHSNIFVEKDSDDVKQKREPNPKRISGYNHHSINMYDKDEKKREENVRSCY